MPMRSVIGIRVQPVTNLSCARIRHRQRQSRWTTGPSLIPLYWMRDGLSNKIRRITNKLKFEPLHPISLVDLIVHHIEELMLKGELTPGERLPPERDLAALLQVSRTSVRQAMAILKARGLVSIRAGSGAYAQAESTSLLVTPLAQSLSSLKERVLEPMEVRQLLEPQIARLAAERAVDEDIHSLEALLDAQKACMAEGRSFVDEDIAFHRQIAASTYNGVLIKLVDNSLLMLRDSREISLSTMNGAQTSWKGHVAVLKAIKNHDLNRAYESMDQHITAVSNLIRRYMAASSMTD